MPTNKISKRLFWLLTTLCRYLLAATFILSGFVKAVDPLGTQYKIEDYLSFLGISLQAMDGVSLILALALIVFEFFFGVLLFFSIRRYTTTSLLLLFMVVSTPVTLYLAITDPIKDCGCFGDAWVLTNWQTFGKNVVLLFASIIVFFKREWLFRLVSERNQWIVSMYTLFFILIFSIYSTYRTPILDFRPYHIGANIPLAMSIPEGETPPRYETRFVMEKEGEWREFSINDYPDTTWLYVDRVTKLVEKGYTPTIDNFSLVDFESGEDITDELLRDTSYSFLLISPRLEKADGGPIDLINELYDYSSDHGYKFYAVTSSSDELIQQWIDETAAEYPFCIADEVVLKTIIRSNPGLLLLKGGVVVNKWGRTEFPDEYQLNAPLQQLEFAQLKQDSIWNKIVKIVLWYLLPLLFVFLADRIWVGSAYYKRMRTNKKNILSTFQK